MKEKRKGERKRRKKEQQNNLILLLTTEHLETLAELSFKLAATGKLSASKGGLGSGSGRRAQGQSLAQRMQKQLRIVSVGDGGVGGVLLHHRLHLLDIDCLESLALAAVGVVHKMLQCAQKGRPLVRGCRTSTW